MENANTQRFLKESYLSAHGCWRDSKLVGRQREAAQTGHSFKLNQGRQRRYKSSIPLCAFGDGFHVLMCAWRDCPPSADDIRNDVSCENRTWRSNGTFPY